MATEGTSAQRPLAGVRVLDLANVLAGPFACHQLAHLGAEVIKVGAVGHGDLARNLGADPDLSARGMGIRFLAQNAGKKSLTLNLNDTRGKEALTRLVKTSDVLVENFCPCVMDRLGLDEQEKRPRDQHQDRDREQEHHGAVFEHSGRGCDPRRDAREKHACR